jgi:hypothetical protein
MKKSQNLFLLLVSFLGIMLCICNTPAYAQDNSNSNRQQCYWLNLGLGATSWELPQKLRPMELTLGVSFSYQTGKNLFSIRYTNSQEILGDDWSSDFGILYGRAAKTKFGFASISAGIGLVHRVKEEEEEEDFTTVGIPIQGRLFFTPLPFLGVGIYPFANLNLKDIPVGLLLCVQIGKLR